MSCRRAREFLAQKGTEAEERDYFSQRFTREELIELLGGRPAAELFAWKSTVAKARNLTPGSLSERELIDLMVEEPRLIRRPILKVGERLVPGFSARQWDEALSTSSA